MDTFWSICWLVIKCVILLFLFDILLIFWIGPFISRIKPYAYCEGCGQRYLKSEMGLVDEEGNIRLCVICCILTGAIVEFPHKV